MELLKKNVFWLFCVVVVLGVVVFWGKWIREAANRNRKLSGELKGDLDSLRGIAGKTDEIVTKKHIKAAEAYKKGLRAEAEELESEFAEHQLKLDPIPGVDEPPVGDTTRFREWLTKRHKELCAGAAGADMRCDTSDPVRHGGIPEGPVAEKDIPKRLRQYRISREIHRMLAETKVTIPSLTLSKTGELDEVEATQERGVQELRRIEWMTPGQMRISRTGKGGGARGKRDAGPRFPEPFESYLFELEFVVHFSLVPKIIQKLEASKSFFLVVKRTDVGRMPDTSSGPGRGGPLVRGGSRGASRREEYKNQRYMEAPVRVILECEVLEFDFSKHPDPLAPKEAN